MMRARVGLTFVLLVVAATGCRSRERPLAEAPKMNASRVVIGGLSLSLPNGFVRKAYERSREPLLNIPGQSTDQVFASWEGPQAQSLCLFYWSVFPPRDLGPMVAAKRWKTTIAGQESEAAETETFMGRKQQVLVAWLEKPRGEGRFMIYATKMPREAFDRLLASASF